MLARVRPTACLRGAAERESRNLQTGYAAELRYSQATRSDVTIGIDSSSTRRQYGSSDKTPFSAGLYVTAQTALCRWVSLQDADKSARFRNAGNPTRKPVSMLLIKADVRQSGYDENGVPAGGSAAHGLDTHAAPSETPAAMPKPKTPAARPKLLVPALRTRRHRTRPHQARSRRQRRNLFRLLPVRPRPARLPR